MTPGVAVSLVLTAGVVALGIFGGVVYLSALGIDTGPAVTLAGSIVGAVTGPAALLVQLVNRAATTKVERNTGVLAANTGHLVGAVYEVADSFPRRPAPPRHSDDTVLAAYMEAAPGPRGS